MVGSGIFIVPAEMARSAAPVGCWWHGELPALSRLPEPCYGELSAMMPQAGGMYVYLREADLPLWGFLYGWTLFSAIETGTNRKVGAVIAYSMRYGPDSSRVEQTFAILPCRR
jgi:APA family basic amino acid/polyamine antiporter